MPCQNPRCLGKYDFEHIAFIAIKRFVEGRNTVELLGEAKSEREKEEIALVCLLHLDDDAMGDFKLSCDCDGQCKAIKYRNRLKNMIQKKIGKSFVQSH